MLCRAWSGSICNVLSLCCKLASRSVEVSLEEAAQDLSNHRCLIRQESERNGVSKEPTKVSQPELEELVKVMISCEEQADELYGHFSVWQDNLSTVRSMTLVDPLAEEIQEAGRQRVDTPFLCFVQRVSSVSRFIENSFSLPMHEFSWLNFYDSETIFRLI